MVEAKALYIQPETPSASLQPDKRPSRAPYGQTSKENRGLLAVAVYSLLALSLSSLGSGGIGESASSTPPAIVSPLATTDGRPVLVNDRTPTPTVQVKEVKAVKKETKGILDVSATLAELAVPPESLMQKPLLVFGTYPEVDEQGIVKKLYAIARYPGGGGDDGTGRYLYVSVRQPDGTFKKSTPASTDVIPFVANSVAASDTEITVGGEDPIRSSNVALSSLQIGSDTYNPVPLSYQNGNIIAQQNVPGTSDRLMLSSSFEGPDRFLKYNTQTGEVNEITSSIPGGGYISLTSVSPDKTKATVYSLNYGVPGFLKKEMDLIANTSEDTPYLTDKGYLSTLATSVDSNNNVTVYGTNDVSNKLYIYDMASGTFNSIVYENIFDGEQGGLNGTSRMEKLYAFDHGYWMIGTYGKFPPSGSVLIPIPRLAYVPEGVDFRQHPEQVVIVDVYDNDVGGINNFIWTRFNNIDGSGFVLTTGKGNDYIQTTADGHPVNPVNNTVNIWIDNGLGEVPAATATATLTTTSTQTSTPTPNLTIIPTLTSTPPAETGTPTPTPWITVTATSTATGENHNLYLPMVENKKP